MKKLNLKNNKKINIEKSGTLAEASIKIVDMFKDADEAILVYKKNLEEKYNKDFEKENTKKLKDLDKYCDTKKKEGNELLKKSKQESKDLINNAKTKANEIVLKAKEEANKIIKESKEKELKGKVNEKAKSKK